LLSDFALEADQDFARNKLGGKGRQERAGFEALEGEKRGTRLVDGSVAAARGGFHEE
jgi:hypothetical protein